MDIQKLCDPGIGCGSMCIVLLQCVRIYSLQHLFLWDNFVYGGEKERKVYGFCEKGTSCLCDRSAVGCMVVHSKCNSL